jgi:UDP-3-O-[3-hydroxymyristoyl] glucosamine N-acyltransferase
MVTFADVIRALGGESGSQRPLHGVSSSTSPKPQTVSFLRRWTADSAELLAGNPQTLFIVPMEAAGTAGDNLVAVVNPRLAYALAVRDFLQPELPATIAATAFVSEGAELGEGVSVGHFAVIEDGVVVGPGSVIDHHVVLRTGVQVGSNTRIGSHTSIGERGFGFEMDDRGRPIRIGHMGGVVIGDDVEIGVHCSIAQGTIEPTRILDHVKIDDAVFIAHNVCVGENSFIIAGAEISGSVVIGRDVWISPEVAVINKVSIGDGALVGIGAVVVKDVEPNTIVAGVPAKKMGDRDIT